MTTITLNGQLARDDNGSPVMGGTSSSDNKTILNSAIDPSTRRLLTDSSSGSGSVTSVSVVTANGFAGTVATATTTPAITLSTTITGILKGNGTAISAATVGTDYSVGTASLSTGVLKSTTSTGALSIATGADLPSMTATVGGAVPTPPNNTTTFLRGDGTFAAPSAVAGSIVVGTTTISGGTNFRVLMDNSGILGEYATTGTGTVAMSTSPTFITPTLGAATATSLNGNTFTTGTYTLTGAAGKTLTFNNSLTLSGTDSTTMTFPTTSATIARTDAAQTFTGIQTIPQILNADNAIAATSNAATVTRSNRNNVVTNSSASGLTITLSTSGATAGDMIVIKSLPSTNVAQTVTWVNTESSSVIPSANLNASTTSPRTDGFYWNPLTSLWRCIASA